MKEENKTLKPKNETTIDENKTLKGKNETNIYENKTLKKLFNI